MSACIFTVDTWSLGWRHDDVATSNYAFYKGVACDLGLSDPVFMERMKAEGISSTDLPKIGERWVDSYWHGVPWSWDDLPNIISLWKEVSGGKPFGVKGIQRPEVSVLGTKRLCATKISLLTLRRTTHDLRKQSVASTQAARLSG